MTPERIAQLKALCSAAPGGKWKLWTSNSWRRFKDENSMPVIEPTVQASDGHPDLFLAAGVAPFIEEASTALPECLAEIDRLNLANQHMREDCQILSGIIDKKDAEIARLRKGLEEIVSARTVTASPQQLAHELQQIASAAISQASQSQGTPSSHWAAEGQPDPHGEIYNCERAELTFGHLTDDELANAAFLNYDRWPPLQDVIDGKAHPPIVYMTAVKERIRWLSRRLSEQPSQAPLCEACGVRHWPMQNTLCPATEKTWAGVYKARGYKLVPINPTPEMKMAALKHAEKWAKLSDDPEQEANANAWDYLQAYDVMVAAAPVISN